MKKLEIFSYKNGSSVSVCEIETRFQQFGRAWRGGASAETLL